MRKILTKLISSSMRKLFLFIGNKDKFAYYVKTEINNRLQ